MTMRIGSFGAVTELFRITGRIEMLVGVPKEIKTREFRVGLVPSSVAELVHRGHQVLVETHAGIGIGAGVTMNIGPLVLLLRQQLVMFSPRQI